MSITVRFNKDPLTPIVVDRSQWITVYRQFLCGHCPKFRNSTNSGHLLRSHLKKQHSYDFEDVDLRAIAKWITIAKYTHEYRYTESEEDADEKHFNCVFCPHHYKHWKDMSDHLKSKHCKPLVNDTSPSNQSTGNAASPPAVSASKVANGSSKKRPSTQTTLEGFFTLPSHKKAKID